jgi:membrane protein CcdC involved in cytochrome C biogenesis
MGPQEYGPLIGVAVALPLILLRNRRPRTLRPQWMWVLPVIIVALMGLAIWGTSMQPGATHQPFNAASWGVIVLGLILGGVAGWWRGRMTTIEKHADSTLKAQASPIGLILIVALLLGRRALSAWLEPHAASLGLDAIAVADAFLVFVVGMIVVQRIEMFIRAKRVQAGRPDDHVEAAA